MTASERDEAKVPHMENKIIPFMLGDGIGADIVPAMQRVLDVAVAKAYRGSKTIEWLEVFAGDRAKREFGTYLPEETLDAFRSHGLGIKGPLTTPVGKGFRSLNVAIRQALDLYSCIRPIRWFGSSCPLPDPQKVDLVIFRENTEGLYAGVEFEAASPEAKRIMHLLSELGVGMDRLEPDSGLGIKIASEYRSKRHVRKAFRYAHEHGRHKLTIVHKGNIMWFTEGAFLKWSHEVSQEPEFMELFSAPGQLVLEDRIADNMFQQIFTRPDEFDVVVTTNLNGDYLSEAAAAIVGGVGMVPSCNMGDDMAVFEATHGSVSKYAGQDKANPTSMILAGALMLSYMGWTKSAEMIEDSVSKTLAQKIGTFDIVRGWLLGGDEEAHEVSCSEFAAEVASNI